MEPLIKKYEKLERIVNEVIETKDNFIIYGPNTNAKATIVNNLINKIRKNRNLFVIFVCQSQNLIAQYADVENYSDVILKYQDMTDSFEELGKLASVLGKSIKKRDIVFILDECATKHEIIRQTLGNIGGSVIVMSEKVAPGYAYSFDVVTKMLTQYVD